MYENYRAISLLSSVSELIELAIKQPLNSFLSLNNLLSNSQHGFTSNRSTETHKEQYWGPFCFNDMLNLDISGKIVAYADDTVLVFSGSNWESVKIKLCVFHHKIMDTLDSKKCVLRIFIDFSQAFDYVDH